MTRYLTLDLLLEIHENQLQLYGGASGIRDVGLIESALHRPQSGYYTDLVQEAAALWESLSQNHPFIDGNKRTALVGTYVFLYINGLRIVAGPLEPYEFVIGLYENGRLKFEFLEIWLREHTVPV